MLWQGQVVSQAGSQVFAVASILYVKHETESASLLGLLMMASMIPLVLLGPVGGAFADLHSRRSIIIIGEVLSGLAMLSMGGLTYALHLSGTHIISALFLVSIAMSAIWAFTRPAISASLPNLVPAERLPSANSLMQGSFQVSVFVGQGLAGVLFRLLGAPLLFLLNGLTFVVSAVAEYFIVIPQPIPERTEGWMKKLSAIKKETVDGFLYTWKRPELFRLYLIFAALNFFLMPIITLFPFYVEDRLHATSDWYGFLVAGFGAGAVIGNAIAGGVKMPGTWRSTLTLVALMVFSAESAGLGFVPWPFAALTLVVVGGMMNGFLNSNIATVVQWTTPPEMCGRVFGFMMTIAGALTPISMGMAGVVADVTHQNIPLIYLVCGASELLLCCAVAMDVRFRRFLACQPATGTEGQNRLREAPREA